MKGPTVGTHSVGKVVSFNILLFLQASLTSFHTMTCLFRVKRKDPVNIFLIPTGSLRPLIYFSTKLQSSYYKAINNAHFVASNPCSILFHDEQSVVYFIVVPKTSRNNVGFSVMKVKSDLPFYFFVFVFLCHLYTPFW